MGSMFGKADDSSSREMINMEKEQAAEVARKEAERQGRINAGLAKITEAFTGKNQYKKVKNNPYKVTAPKAGTQSGTAVSGLPAGYKYVLQPGTTTPGTTVASQKPGAVVNKGAIPPNNQTPVKVVSQANIPPNNQTPVKVVSQGPIPPNNAPRYLAANTGGGSTRVSGNDGFGSGYAANNPQGRAGTTTPSKWVVQGPDGKFYEVGSSIDQGSKDVFTGRRTGGVPEDLYNDFRKEFLGYYEPQVADKYAAATNETNFRLARAGTLRSTASANAIADLAKQNKLNVADVRNKADTATGELRTRVENEKAKAISQLYATENPDVAANQATAAVKNITAATPTASPLGDIFTLASIGGAKYLQGVNDSSFNNRAGAIRKAAQTYVA